MNTPHDPTEDILELTDIVEEGAPAGTGLDFAMDKAVDARSLDLELDDLLRDPDAARKPAPGAKPDTEFPPLFAEARNTAAQPAPQAAAGPSGLQDDPTDLDDLFDSLQLDDADVVQTSLDLLLDEKSQQRTGGAEPRPADETIDLDLDIPGIDDGDSAPDLLELTDEILADIPDTVLVPPLAAVAPQAVAPQADEPPILPSPEGLDLGLEVIPARSDAPAAPKPQPAQPATPPAPEPVAAHPGEGVVSHAEFEILSARLDALEARPEPVLDIRPEQVLAALPDSPDGLPLARSMREGILQSVDEKLAAAVRAEDLASLRLLADGMAARIAALEARPEPTPVVGPEQVLAALPDSPDDLPLTRNMREDILRTMDEKLAAAAAAAEFANLRQTAEDLAARVAAVEARPEPVLEIRPDQVLAALPDSPAELPLARSLREEILAQVEAKASAEALERMQRAVEAMQDHFDAMPEILAKLASTSAPALQELESGLGALQHLAKGLEQSVEGVRTAMAGQDATMAELREGQERLREEVEALTAQLENQPNAGVLRNELEAHIRQQVPAAVGRIIREEIQALLKEMGS